MPRSSFGPMDVKCPRCNIAPGLYCRSVADPTRRCTRPHALRTIAARRATEAVTGPRQTSSVSDAWTCRDCGATFWPPPTWSPRMWQAARDAAQIEHGRRHREEHAAAASDPPGS